MEVINQYKELLVDSNTKSISSSNVSNPSDFEVKGAELIMNSKIETVSDEIIGELKKYGSRILIVEDTPIQAKKLKFYLEQSGFEVVWSLNGKQALDELEKSNFDLVMTDVQMPEMDGLQMLACIRNNSKIKNIPVIVITTLDTDDACIQAITLGADDFIAKPFKPRETSLRINTIVTRRRSEELARVQLEAIESSMDGMAIVNREGEYVYVNDAQVKVFGYLGHDDIVGNNWEVLYPPHEVKRLKEEILPIFRKNGYWIGEIEAIRRDGSIYEQEMSLTEVEDGKFVSICRDISDRKRQEKEKEELRKKVYLASRLASVGGLAAGVAHEINNPLTILVGYLQRLKKLSSADSYDSEKCLSIIDKLKNTTSRISKIVENMKIYSKIELNLEMIKIDIHQIINNALELVKSSFETQNVHIGTQLRATSKFVMGDSSKFLQVLVNIIHNARDALEEKGGGIIEITTDNIQSSNGTNNGEKEDNLLEVRIIDNGHGISKEIIDKIFDAFFTTRPIGKGTGLGLSICYSVISEMKGSIEVQSEVGEGSTFIIKIPLAKE